MRPTPAEKREACERLGHWREVYRGGAWYCRRCGDRVAKR